MEKTSKILTCFLTLVLLSFLLPQTTLPFPSAGPAGKSFPQQSTIDYQKMKRDIRIMESILDRLLNPDYSSWMRFGSGSQGIYWEGYGVVFKVPVATTLDDIMDNLVFIEKLNKQKQKLTEFTLKLEKERAEKEKIKEEKIAKLKKNIIEFLGDYADAINQLRTNDWIVIVTESSSRYVPFKTTHSMVVKAKKGDISAYRRGEINLSTFKKRIDFSEKESKTIMDRDIDIMANILATALEEGYIPHFDFFAGKPKGIYLEGCGAMFLFNLSSSISPHIFTSVLKASEKALVISTGKAKERGEKEKTPEEKIKELKQQLIELLATYGHTLRQVKPNEWVGIAAGLDSQFYQGETSTLLIKVKKKYIDDYHKDRIGFEDFKKRVQILEY